MNSKLRVQKFAIRKFAGGEPSARTIRARVSDESVDRDGDVVVASGCDSTSFKKNPVVLWGHDSSKPIARAKLIPASGAIDAEITFPEAGVSAQSDLALGLVKAGVLNGVSIGFSSIERSPLSGGGCKFTKWELLEISLVSIPANPNALVTQKSATSPKAAADKAKAALDQVERHHVDACDALHEASQGEIEPAAAFGRLLEAVTKARAHARVATEMINQLRKLPGTQSAPDEELAYFPARTKASLAALDARDVGKAAIKQPGALLDIGNSTAQHRREAEERLRRFWSQ